MTRGTDPGNATGGGFPYGTRGLVGLPVASGRTTVGCMADIRLVRPHPGDVAVAAAAAVALSWYLAVTPQVPDLAAQVARAEVVRRVGQTVWWLGWFGGMHLPSYSATSPMLMAVLGVTGTGAVATVVSVTAMHRLLRGSVRPRLGTAAFLVTSVANLVDGRITFALAMATGLWCLAVVDGPASMPRAAAAGALAFATCLTSPLGGLFLALAAATLLLVRRHDRSVRAAHGSARLSLALLVLLVLTAAGTALLFPDVGEMPFRAGNFLPAAGCALAVAALCPNPRIRVGALAYLVLELGFLAHPSAVGVNITRVAWLFTLPVVVAYARVPLRLLVAAGVAAMLLPAADLVGQLRAATDASASAAFYPPLLRALAADAASRPGRLGQRVEVLDPRNHWASAYLPARFPLARGWERQADRADNPLFYSGQRLDPAAYRRWLDSLAVGWVAVPAGPLDYASVPEARLVASHPAYLTRVWASRSWSLYRVVDARPLASPATVVQLDDRAITLEVGAATRVDVAVRWSRYLIVTGRRGTRSGCVGSRAGWTYLTVPAPGRYVLTADFDGSLRHGQQGCPTGG